LIFFIIFAKKIDMETIRQKFYEKYQNTSLDSIRNHINLIDWQNRLIGIKGSRGVGKTTLLLQYIKSNYQPDDKVMYVSLDDFYFLENRLYNFASDFYKRGGELLIMDEVHRYPNWSVEIKNLYDDFAKLKMIFTGSSMLQLKKARADLSRRAVMYELPGLSFREYVQFETQRKFSVYTFEEILQNHITIAMDISSKIKPLTYFDKYLQFGYYPFYMENLSAFHSKLSEVITTVIEIDIPQFENIMSSNLIYIKKLLKIISGSVPFKPNMNSLSERTGISLNTMKLYLQHLKDANLILMLNTPEKSLNELSKPEKIFLHNTNIMYNLAAENINSGNIRETFLYNQLNMHHKVYASEFADFLIDQKYNLEVGGKNKTRKQIINHADSFIVKDNIEIGSSNIIPLWLFGFLY